jgi:Flp pilus assembly protein TadG
VFRLFARRRSRVRSRGQSLVEFALILPIFLLFVATAIDAGRLYFGYVEITNAAKEGSLYGSTKPQCTVTTAACPNPGNIQWRVVQEMGGATDLTIASVCTSPAGVTRSAMTGCREGDTIRVNVSRPFGVVTPVMRTILGPTLTVSTSSSAMVFNPGSYTAATPPPPTTAAPTTTAAPGSSATPAPSITAAPTPDCKAPLINFTKTPTTPGPPPRVITFTGSVVGGGTPTLVRWTFGDGKESNAWPVATNTYAAKGKYAVSLTVQTGASIACSTTYTVANYVHVN